jgi:hypothetical protein
MLQPRPLALPRCPKKYLAAQSSIAHRANVNIQLVNRVSTVTVLGLAVALVVGVGCTGTPVPATSPPSMSRFISAEDAIAAVLRFAPDATDLRASAIQSGAFGQFYTVDGTNVHANVDAVTGLVGTLFLARLAPDDATVAISEAEALLAARQFLDSHGMAVAGPAPTLELRDHGETNEYLAIWQHRINGALVPDSVRVSVNPKTAAIFSLVRVSRPYVAPPQPVVTLDQAIAAARVAADLAGAQVETSDLVVAFAADGSQRLVWQIALRSGIEAAFVEVDAIDGQAEVTGRG